jgi:hypothetical protein
LQELTSYYTAFATHEVEKAARTSTVSGGFFASFGLIKGTTDVSRRLLIDRRARFLINELQGGNPDDVFTTKSLAHVLGVSTQFLEIGRMEKHSYGPPHISLGIIKGYRRDGVLKWLETRAKAYDALKKTLKPVNLITMA